MMAISHETKCKNCDGRGYKAPSPIYGLHEVMQPIGTVPCSLCKGTGRLIDLLSYLKVEV